MGFQDTPEEWQVTATVTPFTLQQDRSVRTDNSVATPEGSVHNRDYQVHPVFVAVLALDGDGRGAGPASVPSSGAAQAVGDPGGAAGRPR